MRTKVTLVLVFLNVVLFFFIFKFEPIWRTDRAMLEARRRVLGTETADIRTITIQTSQPDQTVRLVRQGDTWSLAQPIDWPANPHAVSRIINELQFLEHETSFSVADLGRSGQSLADYGLDHPRMTVSFTSGSSAGDSGKPAEPVELRIGEETKVGNRLYILSPDGQRIHVVSQSLGRTLALRPEELRADTLFTIPVFEARSLALQTATPASLRIRLRRDGSRWIFDTPIVARASRTATELAINALNSLRVGSFVSQNTPEGTPTANPALRITLEGNNRRETLIVGTATGAADKPLEAGSTPSEAVYFAQVEGKAALFTVTIPNALLETLRNSQETLREARLLDLDPRVVTAIAIRTPGQPEVYLKSLDSGAAAGENMPWQIVRRDPAQGPLILSADQQTVQRLLEDLAALSARKFISDAPSDADLETWGFNRPEREVALSVASGVGTTAPTVTHTLQIGLASERDGRAYARLAGARSVYVIDAEMLRQIPSSPLAYRERLLADLPAGARITKLTLTRLTDGGVLYDRMLATGDSWPVVFAGEPLEKRAALEALLAQLQSFRAKRFVLDHFPEKVTVSGAERPWQFRLDVTVALPGGSGEQSSSTAYFFTDRAGGGIQWAGSPALAAVFEIEQPLLDALWVLTYGPRDPGPANGVTPATHGETPPRP